MRYRSTRESVLDLERNGMLARVREEVDPDLEMAAIHRRVHRARGPAILYERVKGSPFPAVSNLFGTLERCRFLLRSTLERVERVVRMKADPGRFRTSPGAWVSATLTAARSLPRRVSGGAVLGGSTTLDRLPAVRSWPLDGGPFITLPQVFTREPGTRGVLSSNLGMYRVQTAGGEYAPDEVGLHYQICRGIAAHHARALELGEPLRASVFVGGPPAHCVAAVLPLPEGLSELLFAGMLAGRRFRWTERDGHVISTDADFCITGTIDPERLLPEGPFGDHLGYYSLAHDYPVMRVERVWCRRDAIWPFTVVGRPPQEDSVFGRLVHELTAPAVPREIPGVKALNAVDAAGVHPLLLVLGSERYVPYREREPRELLTVANAVLGFGQCSLAKYLMIAAAEDDPELEVSDVGEFLRHVLERADWRRDLHFQTRTTIDTLDYSGTGLHRGSKLVIAAAGPPRRELARRVPEAVAWPDRFGPARCPLAGTIVVEGPSYEESRRGEEDAERLAGFLEGRSELEGLPLVVLVDDAEMVSRDLRNFLWVTFTRSNPSHDVHGAGTFSDHKHWGCRGPLVIDARRKPHHAPPLEEDPEVTRRVEKLAGRGGSLEGLI